MSDEKRLNFRVLKKEYTTLCDGFRSGIKSLCGGLYEKDLISDDIMRLSSDANVPDDSVVEKVVQTLQDRVKTDEKAFPKILSVLKKTHSMVYLAERLEERKQNLIQSDREKEEKMKQELKKQEELVIPASRLSLHQQQRPTDIQVLPNIAHMRDAGITVSGPANFDSSSFLPYFQKSEEPSQASSTGSKAHMIFMASTPSKYIQEGFSPYAVPPMILPTSVEKPGNAKARLAGMPSMEANLKSMMIHDSSLTETPKLQDNMRQGKMDLKSIGTDSNNSSPPKIDVATHSVGLKKVRIYEETEKITLEMSTHEPEELSEAHEDDKKKEGNAEEGKLCVHVRQNKESTGFYTSSGKMININRSLSTVSDNGDFKTPPSTPAPSSLPETIKPMRKSSCGECFEMRRKISEVENTLSEVIQNYNDKRILSEKQVQDLTEELNRTRQQSYGERMQYEDRHREMVSIINYLNAQLQAVEYQAREEKMHMMVELEKVGRERDRERRDKESERWDKERERYEKEKERHEKQIERREKETEREERAREKEMEERIRRKLEKENECLRMENARLAQLCQKLQRAKSLQCECDGDSVDCPLNMSMVLNALEENEDGKTRLIETAQNSFDSQTSSRGFHMQEDGATPFEGTGETQDTSFSFSSSPPPQPYDSHPLPPRPLNHPCQEPPQTYSQSPQIYAQPPQIYSPPPQTYSPSS